MARAKQTARKSNALPAHMRRPPTESEQVIAFIKRWKARFLEARARNAGGDLHLSESSSSESSESESSTSEASGSESSTSESSGPESSSSQSSGPESSSSESSDSDFLPSFESSGSESSDD